MQLNAIYETTVIPLIVLRYFQTVHDAGTRIYFHWKNVDNDFREGQVLVTCATVLAPVSKITYNKLAQR